MNDEGFEITVKKYKDDEHIQKLVRTNSQLIPAIKLWGSDDKKEDNLLFEEIIRYCRETTKTLVLICMKLNLSTDKLKMFPLLSKVVFEMCTIEDDSILRFNGWCPNSTEIRFKRSIIIAEKVFDTFIRTDTGHDVVCPQVKKFEFNFGCYHELTRQFMAAMDQKFPALEDLKLWLDIDCFSRSEPEFNVPYEPLYFKNLKKLFVHAFGEVVDQLFDYMAVSNAKLKEVTFCGMTASTKVMKWIENCKRLGKLTLDCPYLDEYKMNRMPEMKWLREVKLGSKYFHWEPKEMLEFVRTQQGVKKLVITSDRKNNSMKYGEEFKKLFADLVKEREQLVIHVEFCEGRREIKISAKGFSETQEYETPSTDDELYSGDEESKNDESTDDVIDQP